MSEYLIKGETLTSIADEVRKLDGEGTNFEMMPGDMAVYIQRANEAIAQQETLIQEAFTALEGKAGGSGGSGGSLQWELISSLPTTYLAEVGPIDTTTVYYLEVPCNSVVVLRGPSAPGHMWIAYRLGTSESDGVARTLSSMGPENQDYLTCGPVNGEPSVLSITLTNTYASEALYTMISW